MKAYPNVNWWPGNLRPNESVIGFAVRFCSHNNLNHSQFEQFFGFEIQNLDSITSNVVQRIAELLNEDLASVQSLFSPSFILGGLAKNEYFRGERTLVRVRYCAECVKYGYHSFIHEVSWLSKCPFHGNNLEESHLGYGRGAKTKILFSELKLIMEARCPSWPLVPKLEISVEGNENFNSLFKWAATAVSTKEQLFKGVKWNFHSDSGYEMPSLEQSIGQLNSLVAIPHKIEHLFTTLGNPWQIELRQFPLEIKNSLKLVTHKYDLNILFDFFKSVGRYSKKNGTYLEKLRIAKDELNQKHTICKCCWGRRDAGYSHHWVYVDPEQWPHWCCKCPYEVAIEELELGWGNEENVLSRRKLEDSRSIFIRLSKDFYDAGFIGYTSQANISNDGQLYLYPQTWPCCEWVDSSKVGELLNTIAEFQIELAYKSLVLWINNIEDGGNPSDRNDPYSCINLTETEEGLYLFKWSRKI